MRCVALLLLPFLLLVGCSDDGDGDDGDSASASTSASGSGSEASADGTTPTTDEGDKVTEVEGGGTITEGTAPPNAPKPITAADREKYCAGWARLSAVSDKPYDSRDPNAVKAHYNELLGVARELLGVAPADIKGALEITIAGAERVAASGDTGADDSDEVRVNGQRLQDYAAEHCA